MSDETQPQQPLPVSFDEPAEGPPVEIPIDKSELEEMKAKAKASISKRALEAKLYQEVGARVIRIKARTLAGLGDLSTKLGVRKVGHGRLLGAGDNTEMHMAMVIEEIETLRARDPVVNADRIIGLLELLDRMNGRLIEIGQSHLKADTQTDSRPSGTMVIAPYPVGSPMILAINPPQDKTIPALEAPPPQG
jgi:hypothetical protein